MRLHVILYVADQDHSRAFYEAVLGRPPRLHVPGMTEFELEGGVLGLMPEAGIQRLLPGLHVGDARTARAELYLRVADPEAQLGKAVAAGAEELAPVEERSWGDRVGYVRDPDGHVVAFAR